MTILPVTVATAPKLSSDMLVFGDKFKQCAAQFGIRSEDARKTIEEFDHYERILFPGAGGHAMSLYLKAARWNKRRIHILVATEPSPQYEVVTWVWPVPASVVSKDPTALEALRDLCERFGAKIRLGEKSGRLIRSAIVEGQPGLPLSLDIEKDARPGFGYVSSRYDASRQAFLVALAYVLDVQALRAELTS